MVFAPEWLLQTDAEYLPHVGQKVGVNLQFLMNILNK